MKLTRLLETITDAKKLALHVQQLALEHNFEYELKYHKGMYVGTASKIQAVELILPQSQVKEIADGLRAHHGLKAQDSSDEYKRLIQNLAVYIVIGELNTTMSVFDGEESPVEQYVEDDLDELIKLHIAPYGRFTRLT